MTNAERFQKALRTILSTPPEQVEQINQQAKDDYAQEQRRGRINHRQQRRVEDTK